MVALLQLLDIVESDEVETAAVECRLEPCMKMNPAFIDAWAATPEKLLMLVMHELHHVLLGHTRLFPRMTPVDNLVFDAIINALLCRMFPEPEHTGFFTDFYDDTSFPECLLRPPAAWHPDEVVEVPPALSGKDKQPVAHLYQALYSSTGAGYHELYDVLRETLTDELAMGIVLVGDHDDTKDASLSGHLEDRSPLLFEIVRSIVERWPQPPDPIAGRSLADLLQEEQVVRSPVTSNRVILTRLLKRVGGVSTNGRTHRAVAQDAIAVSQPVPARDRRAVVLNAMDVPVLLYRGESSMKRVRPSGEQVHVYLDVSGSIGSLKGALYSAVEECRAFVHPAIHLFSTEVADITMNRLRRGECRTTGGTSITCVARHMRLNNVRRAVIITDGWVGKATGEDESTLRRARVGVALTPCTGQRSDLEHVTNYWAQLRDRS